MKRRSDVDRSYECRDSLSFTFSGLGLTGNGSTSATQVLRFAIVNTNSSGNDRFGFGSLGYTDDLATPEPATWGMLAGGLGALALWRRRKV